MVLIVALIVLVAMTLVGISLIRSVSTSNRVAGNLAFQQAATQSADVGIEAAISWLETHAGTQLYSDDLATRREYFAARQDPQDGQSWESFWQDNIKSTGRFRRIATDPAGNTVFYAIHRLCSSAGDPTAGAAGCAVDPNMARAGGNTMGAGEIPVAGPTQQYYRITARVEGPRNTVSFVQVVIAM